MGWVGEIMNLWRRIAGWTCLVITVAVLLMAVMFLVGLIDEYGQAVSWLTLVGQVAVVAVPIVILFLVAGWWLLKSRG